MYVSNRRAYLDLSFKLVDSLQYVLQSGNHAYSPNLIAISPGRLQEQLDWVNPVHWIMLNKRGSRSL